MNQSFNSATFKLIKTIREIRNYSKDWRYVDTFEKFVGNLNDACRELQLPKFQFESFHYSNSGKTISDIGYDSLLTHISVLEEIMPTINNQTAASSEMVNQVDVVDNKKIFIVHGRDKTSLLETESILRRAGLEPIILNKMANSGMTLIEKFEKFSDVKYAVVLLTPDDVGGLNEDVPQYQFRARQNVIFELGFFYGRLGRSNVCCVLKSNVEKPSDIDGIAYVPYKQSVDEIEYALLKELRAANIDIDFR